MSLPSLDRLRDEFLSRYTGDSLTCTQPPADLELMRTVGVGGFGRVFLARYSDGELLAVKRIPMEAIVRTGEMKHVRDEKRTLLSVRFPFIVSMVRCHRDNDYIYFVMPLLVGGDMFTRLRQAEQFDEPTARFYMAQVVLALEYLHHCGLIYRDLKPENILIDNEGYAKLTDFGFCKLLQGGDRAWTLCGTPDYLAPEVILTKGYNKAVDWWGAGVLLFEMCAGMPPFTARDPMKLYRKIVVGKYRCPPTFGRHLKDLVSHLIEVDVTKRYGNLKQGVGDIKSHMWMSGVDWEALLAKKIVAPFVPDVGDVEKSENFDVYNEEEVIQSSTCRFEKEFENF